MTAEQKKTNWSFSAAQLLPIIAVNPSHPQAHVAAGADASAFGAPRSMPLSLNPGFTYQVTPPVAQPTRATSAEVRREPVAVVTDEAVTERSARRSENYVAALRELRADLQSPHQHLATRTYLQVAHYDGDFPLVDVYT